MPWQALAAIGSKESDHGRSPAPGVRAGVNAHGCCAGPMQFNLTDGPPSTWQRHRVDGNHDGHTDVCDPQDAIPSAANYLRALLRTADGDLGQAVLGLQPLPPPTPTTSSRALGRTPPTPPTTPRAAPSTSAPAPPGLPT